MGVKEDWTRQDGVKEEEKGRGRRGSAQGGVDGTLDLIPGERRLERSKQSQDKADRKARRVRRSDIERGDTDNQTPDGEEGGEGAGGGDGGGLERTASEHSAIDDRNETDSLLDGQQRALSEEEALRINRSASFSAMSGESS